MTYQQQLTPWVIHKFLPDLKQLTVSRFRRRTEAEAYLKALRQAQPNSKFELIFDVGTARMAKHAES